MVRVYRALIAGIGALFFKADQEFKELIMVLWCPAMAARSCRYSVLVDITLVANLLVIVIFGTKLHFPDGCRTTRLTSPAGWAR